MTGSSIDSSQFRRILSRNVAMPLGMGVLSALVFVGIIAYLINVLSWVEHSERVIGRANEVSRMSADMEAGMRGYLLSGDDDFMAPYLQAKPKIEAELNALGANGRGQSRARPIACAVSVPPSANGSCTPRKPFRAAPRMPT
jgi:CHASE3 domain sensor protein